VKCVNIAVRQTQKLWTADTKPKPISLSVYYQTTHVPILYHVSIVHFIVTTTSTCVQIFSAAKQVIFCPAFDCLTSCKNLTYNYWWHFHNTCNCRQGRTDYILEAICIWIQTVSRYRSSNFSTGFVNIVR